MRGFRPSRHCRAHDNAENSRLQESICIFREKVYILSVYIRVADTDRRRFRVCRHRCPATGPYRCTRDSSDHSLFRCARAVTFKGKKGGEEREEDARHYRCSRYRRPDAVRGVPAAGGPEACRSGPGHCADVHADRHGSCSGSRSGCCAGEVSTGSQSLCNRKTLRSSMRRVSFLVPLLVLSCGGPSFQL